MRWRRLYPLLMLLAALAAVGAPFAAAEVFVQCPGDTNGDAIPDGGAPPNVKCMHLGAADGFATMADGKPLYTFGFTDLTGIPSNVPGGTSNIMTAGMLAAELMAPTIALNEGDEFYLSLTNIGLLMRPDLFDPHSVHWHGLPNASSVFDGLPESAIVINMGFTFTYYYNVAEPGTYIYHCHVEATEHMAMGMLGNIYVRPAQDQLPPGTPLAGGFVHQAGFRYAYNDGDGTTRYDVDFPVQMFSMDSYFHEQHIAVQPLPFAALRDDYALLNGRGYPDTVNPAQLPPAVYEGVGSSNGSPQKLSSLITASAGQKVLLRLSNVSIQRFFTLQSLGLPMQVVGQNARLLRGPTGTNLYYSTNSISLGGGESVDVILEIPPGTAPGSTFFLYTTNLNYLANGEADATSTDGLGGMLTEIRVL